MSNPFKVFRKNRKLMFAILTILAMVAFVILPAVLESFSMRQASKDPLVVTSTKYGDLTQSKIQNLRQQHECVVGILSGVASKLFGIEEQMLRPALEKMLGNSTDEALVNRWLLDKKATEIGIQVSDDNITEFLTNKNDAFVGFFMRDPEFARYLPYLMRNKSLGKLTPKDFKDIFARYQHVTQEAFYDMLRVELKGQEFQNMFGLSIFGTTPGQRWEYYCRTHQQAQIEAIPVKVDQFVASIQTPKDSELKEYFDKHKDRTSNPYSPEPGFRLPQKIDLEYFVANVDQFAAPDKVTDEEIQAYYEKDPKTYDEMNKKYLLNEAEKSGEQKEPAAKEGEKKETPETARPVDSEKPAESATPPAPADTEKKDGEKKEDAPAAPPVVDKPEEKPADKPEEKSSAVERSPFRFASLLADDTNKDNPEPSKEDAPKTETPAADAPKTEAPKTEAPTTETPATEIMPAHRDPNEAAAAETPAATDQAAPPRRQLTEEVRKEIRRRVAGDKIKAIFDKLQGQMKANAVEQKSYIAAKLRKDTNAKPPAKLDFESLAKQYGITAGNTGEKTFWEARELDIGKSALPNRQPVANAAFDIFSRRSEMSSYSPYISEDENNAYLFWKTKDTPEAAPNWDDPAVKKQVLEAWKLEQARVPALAEAKRLAEQVTKSKAKLKEVFAGEKDREVIAPPPFTWLVGGYNPLNPQYDLNINIKGIDIPGEEFMAKVFALTPQGVTTVMNEPKTIVYVVQLEKFDPADESLWKRFLEDDYSRYADAAKNDRQSAWIALMDELRKEAGLKWEPKAADTEKQDTSNE
jgi:hypothetical protein